MAILFFLKMLIRLITYYSFQFSVRNLKEIQEGFYKLLTRASLEKANIEDAIEVQRSRFQQAYLMNIKKSK